jgi:Polysaccharide pyruvyl transferase
MNDYIVLLDPSIRDNSKNQSYNIGDCIIFESVKKILENLFPHKPLERLSSHTPFGSKEKEMMKNAEFVFVGGTNTLTSDIRHFSRLTPEKTKLFYLFPGFRNVILLGTGWRGYDPPPDLPTRLYYRNILHRNYLHAIRDNYSITHLRRTLLSNLINTSCPATWELDAGFVNKFEPSSGKILFTLTDYNTHPCNDSQLIQMLFNCDQQDLFFFPQGSNDMDYLQSLNIYQKNKTKFRLLNHCHSEFEEFVKTTQFNYAGTRLHAGISCLKANNPTLIISIDNRTAELGKDICLNVTGRNTAGTIVRWLENTYTPPKLQLPEKNIAEWKAQFNKQ